MALRRQVRDVRDSAVGTGGILNADDRGQAETSFTVPASTKWLVKNACPLPVWDRCRSAPRALIKVRYRFAGVSD